MEKAYKDIDTEECRKMLHLDVGKLEKYAEEKEWTFELVHFLFNDFHYFIHI